MQVLSRTDNRPLRISGELMNLLIRDRQSRSRCCSLVPAHEPFLPAGSFHPAWSSPSLQSRSCTALAHPCPATFGCATDLRCRWQILSSDTDPQFRPVFGTAPRDAIPSTRVFHQCSCLSSYLSLPAEYCIQLRRKEGRDSQDRPPGSNPRIQGGATRLYHSVP